MENTQQPMLQPSQEIKTSSNFHFPSSKAFLIILILVVAILSGVGGYLLGKNNQSTNKGNLILSPTITQTFYSPAPSQTSVSPISLPSNCTSDKECSSGYGCQALQGEGTACPIGSSTNGTTTNTSISCTPTYKITSGVCKLKKDGICSTDNDCLSGLICHATQQGNTTVHKCEEPTLGTCSGASDTSCQSGYQCIQGCGPPLIREGDNTPIPWYCMANEIAYKPRACPICLASNTMIATPQGEVNVTNIKVGMQVWSVNKQEEKIRSTVMKIGNTLVPSNHKVVHLILSDGRNLWVSPNHPTITGTVVGNLKIGNEYDNAKITQTTLVPYWDTRTYDVLPDSETGFYYANGILMGSTLK